MSNKKLRKWEFWTFALSIILAVVSFMLALHMVWCAVYSQTLESIVSMVVCFLNMGAFGLTASVSEAVSEELVNRKIPCIFDFLF